MIIAGGGGMVEKWDAITLRYEGAQPGYGLDAVEDIPLEYNGERKTKEN